MSQEPGGHRFFPPRVAVEIKALACELPAQLAVPLSRLSSTDIAQIAIQRGIVATISDTTVWRWLTEDAIKPWQFRSWIFPRDPAFVWKAERVLDLYSGQWRGEPLGAHDFVISADEKTSIQARLRKHRSQPCGPGRCRRVEHEYERGGALSYLAAWDVKRAQLFGRCEKSSGTAAFDRLVEQVMQQEPYRSAQRVFWIVDNGPAHRGKTCLQRWAKKWPTLVPVHLPIHASWLNQIEIYFSILQRKVLTPNESLSLIKVEENIYLFQQLYENKAKPFEWKFTKEDLYRLMQKIEPAKISA